MSPKGSTPNAKWVIISQASFLQRKGRCGRTKHGKHVCLITEEMFGRLAVSAPSDLETMLPYDVCLDFLRDDLNPQTILEISDERYSIIIARLLKLRLITVDNEVTPLGHEVYNYPVDLELAVLVSNAREIFEDSESTDQDKLTGFALLMIASIVSSINSGGSLFFIPRDAEKNAYMEDHFSVFRGSDDVQTWLNVFIAMMLDSKDVELDKDLEQCYFDWATTNSMNNKVLKLARSTLRRLFAVAVKGFPAAKHATDRLLHHLFSRDQSIAVAGFSSEVIHQVNHILSDVYSDRIFTDGNVDRKGRVSYIGSNGEAHMLDNFRAYFKNPEKLCDTVIALFVMENVSQRGTQRFISGIVKLDASGASLKMSAKPIKRVVHDVPVWDAEEESMASIPTVLRYVEDTACQMTVNPVISKPPLKQLPKGEVKNSLRSFTPSVVKMRGFGISTGRPQIGALGPQATFCKHLKASFTESNAATSSENDGSDTEDDDSDTNDLLTLASNSGCYARHGRL
jgi:hypothetical protein